MLCYSCVCILPLPLMFDAAFTYNQVLSKYLVGIEEKIIFCVGFGGQLELKMRTFVFFTSVRGQVCDYIPRKHSLRRCHTETLQAALMSVGSRRLSLPSTRVSDAVPGCVIFILATVLCYLIGMSLITQ